MKNPKQRRSHPFSICGCFSNDNAVLLEDEQIALLDFEAMIELEQWDRVRHIIASTSTSFLLKKHPPSAAAAVLTGGGPDDHYSVQRRRQQRAPSELSVLCSKASTPLDIIELSARKDPSKICIPDEYPFGNTPLHQVCSDSNIHRLKVLLKYLRDDPHQVLVHNDAQQTPLHYAIRCYASLDILQELVRFHPPILEIKHDAYGFDAFFLLWDTDTVAYQTLMAGNDIGLSHESLQKVLFLASEYWKCIGEECNGVEYAVHGLIHYNAFVEIILLALQNQPHTAQLLDRHGNTPLSLLLQYSSLEQLPMLTKWSSPCDIIQKFIEIFPDAAHIPNKMGELPLHHAIRANRDCLGTILDAYPEAMERKDPRSDLYPFQLAAYLDRKLDDIYFLLLAEPTVMQKSRVPVATSTYPPSASSKNGKGNDEHKESVQKVQKIVIEQSM